MSQCINCGKEVVGGIMPGTVSYCSCDCMFNKVVIMEKRRDRRL